MGTSRVAVFDAWEEEVLERTDAFLDSVLEHFDDAETILDSFADTSLARCMTRTSARTDATLARS